MAEAATKTVEGALTGRKLEVDTETGKVIGAADGKPHAGATKDNVVSLPTKGKDAPKTTKTPKGDKAPEKKPTAAPKGKKITLIAKECPARKGSTRAKFWGKLKNGMALSAAKEAGVPLRYLKKMVKAGHLKIG